MPKTYTGEEIVNSVRNLLGLPDTETTGTTDTDILGYVNEAIHSHVLPELVSIREEYFVVSQRITLAAGTSRYRMPERAMWNKLRDIYHVDGQGARNPLVLLQHEEIEGISTNTGSTPGHYFIEGNDLVLLPIENSTFAGFLEVAYFFRPGDLVLSTSARRVSSPLTETLIAVSPAVPSTWTTDSRFDIHTKDSGAEIKQYSLQASLVSGTNLTFVTAINGSLFGTKRVVAGDWVTLEGEAAIPGVPRELHAIVARAGALRAAEALGDFEAVQDQAAMFRSEMNLTKKALESRVEGRPLRIRGRYGMLWAGRRW